MATTTAAATAITVTGTVALTIAADIQVMGPASVMATTIAVNSVNTTTVTTTKATGIVAIDWPSVQNLVSFELLPGQLAEQGAT